MIVWNVVIVVPLCEIIPWKVLLMECWEAVEERRDEPKQGKIDAVY